MIAFRQDEMEVRCPATDIIAFTTNSHLSALHFKISVANDNDVPYDEADIQYTPLLDENRDRDILQLLPDYLTEEITFPRSQAAHFYGRVVDTLMKKQRMVSEDD